MEIPSAIRPGPADVEYIAAGQAGGWGDMLRAFARFVALHPGGIVLDVGAGPALLPRLCVEAGARLAVGCDDSPQMLRRAAELSKASSGVALTWADALRLPFGGGAFDAVLATNLLFLLPEPALGLREMIRVARPGARIAYANPTERLSVSSATAFVDARGVDGFNRFSFVNYGRLAEEHRRLSSAEWVRLAEEAGLEDVTTERRADGLVVFVCATRTARGG